MVRAIYVDDLGPIAYDNRAADRPFESGTEPTGLTSEKQIELAITVAALRTAKAEPCDSTGSSDAPPRDERGPSA